MMHLTYLSKQKAKVIIKIKLTTVFRERTVNSRKELQQARENYSSEIQPEEESEKKQGNI